MINEDGEIVVPAIRTPYNYDRDGVSRGTSLVCTDETKTVQSFKEECDINTIVRNFGVTGEAPQQVRMPLDADFVDVLTYQEALNKMMEAESSFMSLPSDVRARFQNDPGNLIAFCADPKNLEEARKLGLAVPAPAVPEPFEVRVVPTPEPGK